MSDARTIPVGVLLAGGSGSRIGGDKAVAQLGGRPLLSHPLEALIPAADRVAVVAKRSTTLPPLGSIEVWHEPDQPTHPLVGIVEALRRADGRPVLVCAADMPFVTTELLRELIGASSSASATIACTMGGALQPLLGRYEPAALQPLQAALEARPEPDLPMRQLAGSLRPLRVPIEDRDALFNVNTGEDLARAEQLLAQRRSAQP